MPTRSLHRLTFALRPTANKLHTHPSLSLCIFYRQLSIDAKDTAASQQSDAKDTAASQQSPSTANETAIPGMPSTANEAATPVEKLNKYVNPKAHLIVDQMLRSDHALEVVAKSLVQAQQTAFQGQANQALLADIFKHEEQHVATLEKLLPSYRTRPTLLLPLCHLGGKALGTLSACLGEQVAHTCTVAVQDVLISQYNDQLRELSLNEDLKDVGPLKDVVKEHRDDKEEHHQTGISQSLGENKLLTPLSAIVKAGFSTVVWISSRV
eukprot:g78088.t1